ncbi:MAG TPA: hypothetical protein VGJ56_15850 [Reyranella sp.]|jgi:hypothetical protein
MKRRHALLALFLIGPLSACEKKDDAMSPDSVVNQPPPDPAEEEKRLRRPPPARSGIGSDPDNPSGAPGSSRLGSSSTRY